MRQAPFDPRTQQAAYYNQLNQAYYQQPSPPPPQYQPPQPLQAPPQLQMQGFPPPYNQSGGQARPEGPVPVYIREGPSNQQAQQLSGSEQDYQENIDDQGQEEEGYGSHEEQEMHNQQVIMFWEHKFFTIYERFQIIHDKVDWLRTQFYKLNNELKAVDSEAEWNSAKEHHDDYMEYLEQFSQELGGAMNENASLLEQRDMDGEDSGAWKQRYYELFESFKSLEQELNDQQEGRVGNGGGVDEEFLENYRLLERQYTKATKELEEVKSGMGNQQLYEYREKLDYALQEAEKYKEMLDRLHEENEGMHEQINSLKQINAELQRQARAGPSEQDYAEFTSAMQEKEYEISQLSQQLQNAEIKFNEMNQNEQNKQNYYNSLEQQFQARNKEVSELKSKIAELDSKLRSSQATAEEYQRTIKTKSLELQNKQDEIYRVKKQFSSNSLRKNNEEIESLRKEFEAKSKRIEQEYEEKIVLLKKKFKQKEEEADNAALTQIKLESQEKKVKMLLEEIANLTSELHARDKDLMDSKRMSYELEKLKEIEYLYHGAVDEKEQLNAALLQRNYDIDSLQSQINDFESRIRELSDKTFSSNSKSFIHEIEELNGIIQSKEAEISKLRSTINIKESYASELETELEKVKTISNGNERNFEREKDILVENSKHLERKNADLEKKMRELEHEFGSHMRKNLEDEIKSLRQQNQARQETIIRLEGEELELRSRITHYERIRGSHSGDVEELTNRIKQLEGSKSEIIRKVETSYREVRKREKENKELVENEKNLKDKLSRLESQISETDKLIGEKEKIIEQMEKQLLATNSRLSYITSEHDQLRLRRRDQTDLFIKESDALKRKLMELEYKSPKKDGAKSAEYTKIENELVERLTEQKEMLKAELATALQELGHLPDFSKKDQSRVKSRASEGIDYIQKRLFDFNSKLDKMIVKNKQLNERGFGGNAENWGNSFGTSGPARAYEEEIKLLKGQLQELRKYCAKLEVEAEGETARINPKHSIVFMEQEKTYNGKIEFYQGQISTLENRVNSLIEVNTILKERVDSILKGESNTSAASLYREQLLLAEETINGLNLKVKKLQEENRSSKLNTSEVNIKMCREYEDKIFDFENKIFSLERKINNLEMEKSKSDSDKASLARNLHICQSELESIKASSQNNLGNMEKVNKDLNDQSIKLQEELNELLNKVRMLQSDNRRLTQAINASQQQLFMSPFKNSSYKNSPAVLTPKKN